MMSRWKLLLNLAVAVATAPLLHGSTIYMINASQMFSFASTATYVVNSGAGGITSQGFSGSPVSTDPAALTVVLNDSALAGTTVTAAMLDLSRTLSSGTLTAARSLSSGINPGHTVGIEPVFGGAPSGLFVSIVGTLGGTHTINLAGATNYNLLPVFQNDLQAGNPLTIYVTLGNVFSTTSLAASTSSSPWKNETATYTLSQPVSGTFSAIANVTYNPPTAPVPEPVTSVLAGGGLVALAFLGRRFKRA